MVSGKQCNHLQFFLSFPLRIYALRSMSITFLSLFCSLIASYLHLFIYSPLHISFLSSFLYLFLFPSFVFPFFLTSRRPLHLYTSISPYLLLLFSFFTLSLFLLCSSVLPLICLSLISSHLSLPNSCRRWQRQLRGVRRHSLEHDVRGQVGPLLGRSGGARTTRRLSCL